MTPPDTHTSQDPRWQAVATRDASADERFVYAVKTTGVYCRPSCPSRAAKPENMCLFDTAEAAEAAGFRPCLRCHPKALSPAKANAALVAEACRLIETSEVTGLNDLAARIGMSPSHFHRQFKAVTGLTPRQWAGSHRAQRMRAGLVDPAQSITAAFHEAGFGSSSRFYAQSDTVLGMTPGTFRNGGKDADIRFAVGQSTLGAILVAQSSRGICAITLGDDPAELVRDLQDRFPKAHLVGDDPDFGTLVAQVVGLVEAPRIGLDLPLDIRGTAFQERVWQALRLIPPGQTASYADIARQIGAPRAVRAVAQACGGNKLAVAIPCHRVVRTDGALSGYRWGVARKQALLKREVQDAD